MTIKKTAALVLAFTAGTLVFSQVSKTNEASAGVFSTDIDSFMSSTGWSGIDFSDTEKSELIFGDLNSNAISFGYAKDLGALYIAGYLNGSIPRFTYGAYANSEVVVETISFGYGTTTTAARQALGLGTEEFPTISRDSNDFEASVLLGTGIVGTKLGVYYSPSHLTASAKPNGESSRETVTYAFDGQKLRPYAEVGVNAGSFKPYLGFIYEMDKTTSATNNVTTGDYVITNSGANVLKPYLGAGIDFDTDGDFTQSLSFAADYGHSLFSKYSQQTNSSVTEFIRYLEEANLTVEYSGVYEADERLSMGFGVSLPVAFSMDISGTSASTTIDVTTSPAVSAGLQYQLVPQVLTFNAGTKLNAGSLAGFNYVTSSNSGYAKTAITAFGGSYGTSLNAGLCWAITDTITLDTSFSFASKTEASTVTSVWGGAMGAQISFKL